MIYIILKMSETRSCPRVMHIHLLHCSNITDTSIITPTDI